MKTGAIHGIVVSVLIVAISTIGFTVSSRSQSNPTNPASNERPELFPGQSMESGVDKLPKGTGLLPRRFALVIGIDQYQVADSSDTTNAKSIIKLSNLNHPSKDATLMAETLKSAGFEVVERISTSNKPFITKNDILSLVEDLVDSAAMEFQASGRRPVVAFYFSGHGMSTAGLSVIGSVDGNFLIPSDFRPRGAVDIPEMALSMQSIYTRLAASSPTLRIMILDACRNDFSIQIPTPDHSAKVNIVTQHVSQPDLIDRRESADINNSYVIYSTLNGMKAIDDGAFTRELSNAIKDAVVATNKTGSGRQSAIGDIKSAAIASLAQQKIIATEQTMPFRLFSTKNDYDMEKHNWDLANKIDLSQPIPSSRSAFNQETWCRMNSFLKMFTFYSYMYPAVRSQIKDDWQPAECQNIQFLQTTLNSRAPDSATLSTEEWRATRDTQQPANTAVLSKTLIKDAVAPSASKELGKLDTSQPVDELVVAVLDAPLFETPRSTTPVGIIANNELLQVLGPDPSGLMKVRSNNGQVGYIDARAIVGGRSAVDFTVRYAPGVTNVDPNNIPTAGLIGQSIVSDVSIHYREADGAIGFTRAQSLAALLSRTVNAGSDTSQRSLVPSVRAQTPEDGNRLLAEGEIGVVMTVLPLQKEARLQLGQFDSQTIPAALTVNLDKIASTLNISVANEHLSTLGIQEGHVQTQTPRTSGPTLIEQCLASGESMARRASVLPKQIRAYVQIAAPVQEASYNVMAAGLRRAGFSVPAYEIVEPARVPKVNQIRYCQNGRSNEIGAAIALELLNQCGLGSFGPEPIKIPASYCQNRNHDQTVEVWIKQPAESVPN